MTVTDMKPAIYAETPLPGDKKGAAIIIVLEHDFIIDRVPLTRREALALMRNIIRELE